MGKYTGKSEPIQVSWDDLIKLNEEAGVLVGKNFNAAVKLSELPELKENEKVMNIINGYAKGTEDVFRDLIAISSTHGEIVVDGKPMTYDELVEVLKKKNLDELLEIWKNRKLFRGKIDLRNDKEFKAVVDLSTKYQQLLSELISLTDGVFFNIAVEIGEDKAKKLLGVKDERK